MISQQLQHLRYWKYVLRIFTSWLKMKSSATSSRPQIAMIGLYGFSVIFRWRFVDGRQTGLKNVDSRRKTDSNASLSFASCFRDYSVSTIVVSYPFVVPVSGEKVDCTKTAQDWWRMVGIKSWIRMLDRLFDWYHFRSHDVRTNSLKWGIQFGRHIVSAK